MKTSTGMTARMLEPHLDAVLSEILTDPTQAASRAEIIRILNQRLHEFFHQLGIGSGDLRDLLLESASQLCGLCSESPVAPQFSLFCAKCSLSQLESLALLTVLEAANQFGKYWRWYEPYSVAAQLQWIRPVFSAFRISTLRWGYLLRRACEEGLCASPFLDFAGELLGQSV